jgi:hypothetical protein
VIVGFTKGNGKYENRAVGSVWFGQYKGEDLVIRGKCAGMDDELRIDMYQNPAKYKDRVMEIKAAPPVPGSDSYRFPQFRNLRDEDDKQAKDCIWD